jgi:hypothetical protein
MKQFLNTRNALHAAQRSRTIWPLVTGAVLTLTSLPATVFAQAAGTQQDASAGFADKIQAGVNQSAHPSGLDVNNNLMFMIGSAINVVLSLVGVILFGYFVYAGFLYMTAGGEEDKIKSAQNILKNTVIGALILAVSFALATFVLRGITKIVQGS